VSARRRLFVALELTASAREALAAWAQSAPEGVRRVSAENLHVTLAFLGPRAADDAGVVGAVLARAARPVGELSAVGPLWLPPRRPRVLAVELAPTVALAALRADLVARLHDALDWRDEGRAFMPHVTVGRVRRGAVVPSHGAGMADLPMPAFTPPALTLYRTHTEPDGTRHEALARVEL
jgi:2'-5' RNA ligase